MFFTKFIARADRRIRFLTAMQFFGRKRESYGGRTNLLHLTDARRPVVSTRPTRNIVWNIATFPFKILISLWDWVMESKPAPRTKYRR